MARLHWIAAVIVLSICVGTSVQMVSATRAHELWGHLPMIQFLSAWLVIVLVLYRKRAPWNDRYWLYSSLSGFLLALGFLPLHVPGTLFLGFVPLLHILADRKKGGKNFFFYAFNAMIIWNIIATFWVANTAYAAGIFANVVNSLLMTLPLLAYGFISSKLSRGIGLLSFVACWITFEFLHMRWELYWPWLTLGNGLSFMHWGVQWYEYTGVLGGSAWILAINYLIHQIWQEKSWKTKTSLVAAMLMLVPLGISVVQYYSGKQEEGPTRSVVALQPNFEPHYEELQYTQEEIVERFFDLSRQHVTSQTDYLIFPETSFNRVDMDQLGGHPFYEAARALLRDFPNLKLVTGLSGYRWLTEPDEQKLPTSRRIRGNQGKEFFVESYNCAVQLTDGAPVQEYYKALYVPGAEFFPFRKALFFMKPLVDKLGGSIEGYRVREEFQLFQDGEARITPAICYESIFGEFLGHFVRRGSNAIFIMTNDGWWDNTAGHRQHAAFAKLRAIELRRSIARSANMGTCGFINQRGDFSESTDYGVAGASTGQIHLNEKVTFYARWGDFVGRICLFFTLLLGGRASVDRFRKA